MSWEKVKLDHICQIKKGEQLNKLELEKSGEYPCVNGGIEPSGYTDKWNRRENTITISEGGNSCGFVNLLKTKFWSGGHCYSVLNIIADLEKNFLYYALKGRESLIMDLRVGSGLPNIQQSSIKNFTISYPTSITEQKRIAEILSTTDAAIEQTRSLIDKYNRIKRGLMQDLLTCGIDENGNIRSKQTHKFTVKNGIEVPDDWEVFTLEKITTKIVDGVHHTPKYVESGVPFITISDLTASSGISFKSVRFITEYDHQEFIKRANPSAGDILVTKDGTLGVARVVLGGLPEFSIFVSVAMLRPNKQMCIPELIFNFFDSGDFEYQLGKLSAGTGLKHIHLEHFRQFLLATPPIEEQTKIFAILNSFNTGLNDLVANLSKLQAIKKGLMQDLLSGKVRVK